MAGRESVSYDYLAPPRTDDATADTVSSEDAEGETQRCAAAMHPRPGSVCMCKSGCPCILADLLHVRSRGDFRRAPSLASPSRRFAA